MVDILRFSIIIFAGAFVGRLMFEIIPYFLNSAEKTVYESLGDMRKNVREESFVWTWKDELKQKLTDEFVIMQFACGLGFAITQTLFGFTLKTLLICFLIAALVLMAVIDAMTFEIPLAINFFILAIAVFNMFFDMEHKVSHILGFFMISFPLFLIFLASDGAAIGGGDIKLMAAVGLFMGAKLVPVAFFLACLVAVPVHLLRMKIKGAGNCLAMGPYLAIGTVIALWFGEYLLACYIGTISN